MAVPVGAAQFPGPRASREARAALPASRKAVSESTRCMLWPQLVKRVLIEDS
jgi:hypothetical protein